MTELRFDGQVAVITGAGRGLGAEYARLLAARGARVVVNDLGGSVTGDGAATDAAAATVQRIRDDGGEAITDTNTVATPEGGYAIIDAALRQWGRVDIIVNNAGTVRDSPFAQMTPDRVESLIDVHLKGAFFVTRPAWNVMQEQGYGRVVNTCSAAGILGAETMSNYGAAKTGLIGLTRVLAAEGSEFNIKVNAIAPIAATRMLARSMAGDDQQRDPDAQAATESLMRPFLVKLDPARVAPVVAYLAHLDCPVTGEIYSAGAGQVSRFFIGRTKGVYYPQLSVEDVRDHFDEIRDEADYTVPRGVADEMTELFGAIMTD
ncbi:SDR family NAD(P)-dependent oxidoreductase [Mycobacterium sp.]|uniref:SDR family NAD(P)-dependent oxidoreductase n=1 Tax=Mycobacterium sp. TaxID=1785 RepID=UPI003F96B9D9